MRPQKQKEKKKIFQGNKLLDFFIIKEWDMWNPKRRGRRANVNTTQEWSVAVLETCLATEVLTSSVCLAWSSVWEKLAEVRFVFRGIKQSSKISLSHMDKNGITDDRQRRVYSLQPCACWCLGEIHVRDGGGGDKHRNRIIRDYFHGDCLVYCNQVP